MVVELAILAVASVAEAEAGVTALVATGAAADAVAPVAAEIADPNTFTSAKGL